MTNIEKAWTFWRQFGEKPLCLAPMAEINDLPFRIMCRNHGLKVCFTGMINAYQWGGGQRYQNRVFTTAECDHPVIGQIAGKDHDQIISCASDLAESCDAIDVNLGCTQHIAKRGEYGFFSVDTDQKRADTVEMFKRLVAEVNVPITAKIRIFMDENGEPDVKLTIQFAKQLEAAGVSVITVHGRYQHRNKKADVLTSVIKEVVESLKIPVIANGGVTSREEAKSLFEATGAAGVMIGQALLENPTIFDEHPLTRDECAMEYLELVKQYEVRMFAPRKHMFNFYVKQLKETPEIGQKISDSETVDDLINFVNTMKESPQTT